MLGFEGFECLRIAGIDLLQRFQRGKFIIVLQNIFGSQILTKQLHEGFFLFFTVDTGRVRETLLQLRNNRHKTSFSFAGCRIAKALHVLFVAFFQYHILGVFVAKKCNGINGGTLQVPESHDIAEGFGCIIDTVGAGKCLHQAVITQVLVNEQSVKRRGIKAG